MMHGVILRYVSLIRGQKGRSNHDHYYLNAPICPRIGFAGATHPGCVGTEGKYRTMSWVSWHGGIGVRSDCRMRGDMEVSSRHVCVRV
jgi:hypothetical protein